MSLFVFPVAIVIKNNMCVRCVLNIRAYCFHAGSCVPTAPAGSCNIPLDRMHQNSKSRSVTCLSANCHVVFFAYVISSRVMWKPLSWGVVSHPLNFFMFRCSGDSKSLTLTTPAVSLGGYKCQFTGYSNVALLDCMGTSGTMRRTTRLTSMFRWRLTMHR